MILKLIFPLLTIALLGQEAAFGQELSSRQWKNRLLLVMVTDTSSGLYQEQMKLLQNNLQGLKERRLVVYTVLPGLYKVGDEEAQWFRSDELYRQYKRTDSDFEVILIGLDGSVKLRQQQVLPPEELFSTIDAMPMRMQEIKNGY